MIEEFSKVMIAMNPKPKKRVTVNEETKTWQKFVGSPSPMPIEIASAMMIVAAVFSFSAFFK